MTLRIATWNIFFGNDLATILHTIKTHEDFKNLDIFAIQEASIHDGVEDAKRIAAAFGAQYDYYQVTSHIYKGIVQANAIVWNTKKVTIIKKHNIDLPFATDVRLGSGEKILKHFIPSGKRKSLVIEGIIARKSFRLYAAHFDVIGFRHRSAQMACILEDDEKRKQVDFSCILGDLNTFAFFKRPTWINLKELAKRYGYRDITTHITWTFQRQRIRFKQKLDAILLKEADNIKYVCWSTNIAGSDHIPLFVQIEL